MPVLYVFSTKLIMTLIACIIEYFVWKKYSLLAKIVEKNKPLTLTVLILATRILPFVVVFIFLKELPRGDIPFFYYKASHALNLDIVYKDFWSYHSPIFSYLIALPLLIVHHPNSIVAFMMVGEIICAIYTYDYYQKIDQTAFQKLLLYFLMPAPLIICMLGGQEDIWLWGFALLGLNVWLKTKSDFWFGITIAIALLCLKVTFVFFLFPLFFLIKKKINFLAACALIGIPSVGIMYYLVGWDFLMFVKHSEDPYSPNLFSVLRPLFGSNLNITVMNWIGLSLFLSLAIYVGYQSRNKPFKKAYPFIFTITFGLMQLFLPSAMTYYMFIYLIVLVFQVWDVSDKKFFAYLMIFNVLLVIQPFVYVFTNKPVFKALPSFSEPFLVLEYGLEWLFVGMLIYVLWLTYKKLENIIPLSTGERQG